MAATSERASNAPMPKPPALVEANGWNRRLRTKSPSMPTPLSVIAIATVVAGCATATVTGSSRRLASTAFWSRWPIACSSAAASTIAHRLVSPSRRTSWSPRLRRDRRGQDWRAAAAARARWTRARRMRRQAGEQIVHLADRALQRRDHVGAEFGIVGVALGIAGEQRQLADQILDVVEDEGEAAVEFLEPLRVGKRFLAMRLGERARRLAAGGAQQVEILPVERAAVIGRGEQHEADQPLVVDQRNAGPGVGVRRASQCGTRHRRVARVGPAVAQRVEVDDPAARSRPRSRNRARSSSSPAGGLAPASSTPRRRRSRRRCRGPATARRANRQCRRRP